MALMQCTECNGIVSDVASACPHCGAPVKKIAVSSNQEQSTKPELLSWAGAFAVVIAFVAIVIAVTLWILSPSTGDEETKSATTDASTSPDIDLQTQAKVKAIIESRGLWCGRAVRYYEAPLKSSINSPVYYAFCDDGNNAVIYYIYMDRSGKVIAVKED